MQLRPYQEKAITELVQMYAQGKRKIIFQCATGGGKTVTFAGLINRYVKNTGKKVLISVHREELLEQAKKTLFNWYGIIAEPIVAGVKYRNPKANVYVAMVQTASNRIKKKPKWFGDIGMMIIDEAHLKNHEVLINHFQSPETLIVGFTATPISSSKKHPMNEVYEDIVTAIDIPELIDAKALVQNKTYHVKNSIDRNNIKIRNGEFDATEMFNEYSKQKNIENTLKAYVKHAKGKKTIIFNCNVEHSDMVNNLFVEAGYPSKHLDGVTHKRERVEILKWFKETDGAILHNVGVLTAGFDEPSVECVIMNRSTLSLPLWLQCTGRGARTFKDKEEFFILDLGGNAISHGDWSDARDWHFLFHNPEKPGKRNAGDGVAPIKGCVECEALIPAQSYVCEFCGAEQPRKEIKYDNDDLELVLLNKTVNIRAIATRVQQNGSSPYASLHIAKSLIIADAKKTGVTMNETIAYNLLDAFQVKVAEWCKLEKKPYNEWHKQTASKWFFEELKKQFNYEIPKFKITL